MNSPPADAPLVLIVEDEPQIAEVVQAYLAREGLRSALCGNGVQALAEVERLQPALVLLDVQLPGMDGFDVLRTVRGTSDVPVIMLTAFVDDIDRLLGLRLGADDYIAKPFVPAEVVARVRTVLRRARPASTAVPAGTPVSAARPRTLRHETLEIDLDAHEACVVEGSRRQVLPLTLTEFRLLACLAAQPRRVFTRSSLIQQCLPDSDAFDRVVDSHLSKLRRKLATAGLADLVLTVRGVGYRFTHE